MKQYDFIFKAFHGKLDGETRLLLTEVEQGLLIGVLIGEGHFGGDGRQPQISVRMHTRHQRLFERLLEWCPGSKLYGPYHHGGRHYYQWMVRGAVLREQLMPLLDGARLETIDEYAYERYQDMKRRYPQLGQES